MKMCMRKILHVLENVKTWHSWATQKNSSNDLKSFLQLNILLQVLLITFVSKNIFSFPLIFSSGFLKVSPILPSLVFLENFEPNRLHKIHIKICSHCFHNINKCDVLRAPFFFHVKQIFDIWHFRNPDHCRNFVHLQLPVFQFAFTWEDLNSEMFCSVVTSVSEKLNENKK